MNSINITSTAIQDLSSNEITWSLRSIIVLSICSLITIFTILGNGLVLIAVKLRFHARSYSDYFIVSLCLADFFVGLFVMPVMTIHSIYLRWPFHYRLCYIWMSIDFTCSTASFLTLASMALDRYYALTTPYFHLRNRSHTSVLIFIISSWAIPFAVWPFSIFLAHQFISTKPACTHPAHPFIIVILCTCFYYIPLLFMLVCYSRIIVNIRNIEAMIKDTWNTFKFDSIDQDYKSTTTTTTTYNDYGGITSNDKNDHKKRLPSSSQTNTTLCSYIARYFQRNSTKQPIQNLEISRNEGLYFAQNVIATCHKRRGTIVNNGIISNTLSTNPIHRSNRQKTTATFTGQRRCMNELNEDNRSKPDLLINQEEEQIIRTRLSSRASSLPGARCISYYYYQNHIPNQTRMIDDQYRSRMNSITNERSRSQSHSSSQGNSGLVPADISDHSSSFENLGDDEHRRLNRRNLSSHLSPSYNTNRYSQRAVAKFMHERNKARLRRNQKASRMLGILLAVFLICWLPFTISYPAMIFYRSQFPSQLESIIFWFGYFNSLLNPFLYVYSSRNFRQAVIETLCCFARLRSRQQLRYQWSLRD
ncbi:unnamed protein product [Rotaria sordida]|uniref:G-protein coupled receptors family 1 profile domain-containing protein n=1 Tax=Rotaria sordida TaxID=392033 RepID=A0A814YT76_9BILA|nr:unnamed protein product [Rotaria sordida]